MQTAYQILFWFGVLYALFGFAFSHLFHIGGSLGEAAHGDLPVDFHGDLSGDFHGEVPGHVHGDLTGEAPAHGAGDSVQVSPLKPIIIATFCIVSGGTGMVSTHYGISFWLTMFLAINCGALIAWGMFKYIVVPLYRLQNTSAPSTEQLIGLQATVTTPILENGFGTISYRINDNIYNAPAKSLTGVPIDQGRTAAIVSIKDKVFYVHIAEGFAMNIDEKGE